MALVEMTQTAISARQVQLDLAELRYLIVDESRFARNIVKNSLITFGARNTVEINDALGAIRLLNDEDIDMVLVNYDLAHMNGIELTRRIRRCDDLANPEIPIIMISYDASPQAVLEARNAGVHEFLASPFSPESLYLRIHTTIFQPRPFIRENSYVGPDRRWLNKGRPDGREQRKK